MNTNKTQRIISLFVVLILLSTAASSVMSSTDVNAIHVEGDNYVIGLEEDQSVEEGIDSESMAESKTNTCGASNEVKKSNSISSKVSGMLIGFFERLSDRFSQFSSSPFFNNLLSFFDTLLELFGITIDMDTIDDAGDAEEDTGDEDGGSTGDEAGDDESNGESNDEEATGDADAAGDDDNQGEGDETGEYCGDGSCNGDETCVSCPEDCGICADPEDPANGGEVEDGNNDGSSAEEGENIVVVPESGHIALIGSGYMELNTTLDINGSVFVTLIGSLYMHTNMDSIDVWWNLSTGFLEINASASSEEENPFFQLEDFIIEIQANDSSNDADDTIGFHIGLLSANASAHLILSQGITEGSLEFDGIFKLQDFNITTSELSFGNFTISGSLDFSAGLTGDFLVSWNESQVFMDGGLEASASTSAHLLLSDFYLDIEQVAITVEIGNLSLLGGRIFLRLDKYDNNETYIEARAGTSFTIDDFFLCSDLASANITFLSASGFLSIYTNLSDSVALSVSGNLTIRGFEASAKQVGSLGISYLFAEAGVGLNLNDNGASVSAGGAIKIVSLSARVEGLLSLDIGYLLAEGGLTLYASTNAISASGGASTVIMTAFELDVSGLLSINLGNLHAAGGFSVNFGSSVSIGATGTIEVNSLSVNVNLGTASGGLSLTSLSGSGGISFYAKGEYFSGGAGGDLEVVGMHVSGSIIDVANGRLDLNYFYVEGDVSASVDLSSGLNIRAIKSAGVHVSTIIIHGFHAHVGTRDISFSGDFECEGDFVIDYDGSYFEVDGEVAATDIFLSYNDAKNDAAVVITSISLGGTGSGTIDWDEDSVDITASVKLNMTGFSVTGPVQLSISSLYIAAEVGTLFLQKTSNTSFHVEASGNGRITWSGVSGIVSSYGDIYVDGEFDLDIDLAGLDLGSGVFNIDGFVTVSGGCTVSELYVGAFIPSMGGSVEVFIAGLHIASGALTFSIDRNSSAITICANNGAEATWDTFYLKLKLIGYEGDLRINIIRFTGDITLSFVKANDPQSSKKEGSITASSVTGCDLDIEFPGFSAVIFVSPGSDIQINYFSDMDPLLDYVDVYVDISSGLSASFTIDDEVRIGFTNVCANDLSFTYDNAWLLPEISGSISGGAFIDVYDQGEWVPIYPLDFQYDVELYGWGPDDNGWQLGEVSTDQSPATINLKAVINLDGESDGNNSDSSDSTTQDNTNVPQFAGSNTNFGALYSGNNDDIELRFHFLWGVNGESGIVVGAASSSEGEYESETVSPIYEDGKYTATVLVTDTEGNIYGVGSIQIEINYSSLDVVLSAKGPNMQNWHDGSLGSVPVILWPDEDYVEVQFKAEVLNDDESGDNNLDSSDSTTLDNTNGPQFATFSPSGNYYYEFSFGASGDSPIMAHKFTSGGLYTINVKVTDLETGAKGSDDINVWVIGAKLTVTLSADSPDPDVGDSVKFTANVEYKVESENEGETGDYSNNDLIQNDDVILFSYGNDLYQNSFAPPDDNIFTYRFYFDDGSTDETSTSSYECITFHSYDKVDSYKVKVIVTDSLDETGQGSVTVCVGGDEEEEDSCFLENTKVGMADGSLKDIEDVEVGDLVQSYDTDNDEWVAGVVTEVFHHAPEEMTDYYLIINNELRVTPNHPLYVDGKWITADELKVGDLFGDGIRSIEKVYERMPTYNFEVALYHNYKVVWGSTDGIVHNTPEETEGVKKEVVGGTKDSSNSDPVPYDSDPYDSDPYDSDPYNSDPYNPSQALEPYDVIWGEATITTTFLDEDSRELNSRFRF